MKRAREMNKKKKITMRKKILLPISQVLCAKDQSGKVVVLGIAYWLNVQSYLERGKEYPSRQLSMMRTTAVKFVTNNFQLAKHLEAT